MHFFPCRNSNFFSDFFLGRRPFFRRFFCLSPPTFLSMAYLRLLIFSDRYSPSFAIYFYFMASLLILPHRDDDIFSSPTIRLFTSAHQTLVSPFPRAFIPLLFSGTKKCAPKYAFLLSYYFLFLEGGLYVVIRPLLAHAHFAANRADDGADDAG